MYVYSWAICKKHLQAIRESPTRILALPTILMTPAATSCLNFLTQLHNLCRSDNSPGLEILTTVVVEFTASPRSVLVGDYVTLWPSHHIRPFALAALEGINERSAGLAVRNNYSHPSHKEPQCRGRMLVGADLFFALKSPTPQGVTLARAGVLFGEAGYGEVDPKPHLNL
jgi:hypothetical protein